LLYADVDNVCLSALLSPTVYPSHYYISVSFNFSHIYDDQELCAFKIEKETDETENTLSTLF